MKARLTTYGAAFVADVEIPPFQKLPEVLMWGRRCFTLFAAAGTEGAPVYTEACAFYVDEPLPGCCASDHEPRDTACQGFERGRNGRCVYCDHAERCHPGPGAICWIGSGVPAAPVPVTGETLA